LCSFRKHRAETNHISLKSQRNISREPLPCLRSGASPEVPQEQTAIDRPLVAQLPPQSQRQKHPNGGQKPVQNQPQQDHDADRNITGTTPPFIDRGMILLLHSPDIAQFPHDGDHCQ
jgi:hypothetical protein